MSATVTNNVPTTRIHKASKAVLDELSKEMKLSKVDVMDIALETLRRERILKAANESYARMRRDPKASAKFDAEVAAWDTTLGDGLETV